MLQFTTHDSTEITSKDSFEIAFFYKTNFQINGKKFEKLSPNSINTTTPNMNKSNDDLEAFVMFQCNFFLISIGNHATQSSDGLKQITAPF